MLLTVVIYIKYDGCRLNFARPKLQGIFCRVAKLFRVWSIYILVHGISQSFVAMCKYR